METVHAGLDRLSRLADFLEKEVDPKNYNIRFYANMIDIADPSFVGCALGHATRLFASDGLMLSNIAQNRLPWHTITWGGEQGETACANFLGITSEACRELFRPSPPNNNETPTETSIKIREYIRSVGPRGG
jgi:hypothetical protein